MGLEFGYHNPRAATEIVFKQFPIVKKNLGTELGTESMMQLLNDSGVFPNNPIEDALEHWILNHIITSDKKMSLMVQEKRPSKAKLP